MTTSDRLEHPSGLTISNATIPPYCVVDWICVNQANNKTQTNASVTC